MISRQCLRLVGAMALCALLAPLAAAGALRVGSPTIDGENVTVPILLESGADPNVSALDFRFNYDPEVFTPVTARAGGATQAANKQVQASLSSPGEYAVVIIGMNQNTVEAGEVAHIMMQKVGDPPNGRSNVRVARTTLAAPDGAEIPSEGGTGTIDLGEGREVPDTEDEEESGERADRDTQETETRADGSDPSAAPQTSQTEPLSTRDPAQPGLTGRDGAAPPVRPRALPDDDPEADDSGWRSNEALARALERADGSRSDIPTTESIDSGRIGEENDEATPRRTPMGDMFDGDEAQPTDDPQWDVAEDGPQDRQLLARAEEIQAEEGDAPEAAIEDEDEAAQTPGEQQARRGLGAAPIVLFAVIVLGLAAGFVIRRQLVE